MRYRSFLEVLSFSCYVIGDEEQNWSTTMACFIWLSFLLMALDMSGSQIIYIYNSMVIFLQ